MLENYKYDHDELIKYLVSIIKGSVQVNLISDLLGKYGRFRTDVKTNSNDFEKHPHLDILSNYLYERILNNSNKKKVKN